MKKATKEGSSNASQRINDLIAELGDWRGKMLAGLRKVILDAAPELIEEWKWGTAVWTHKGLVCSAGAFKDHVKLNFFKGASLKDPKRLFNAGLDAKSPAIWRPGRRNSPPSSSMQQKISDVDFAQRHSTKGWSTNGA